LIIEVELKRSDARFRCDPNLVEHSVHASICPLTPIIAAQPTSALPVAAPFLNAR
jgi:hypothetical protein